jgi:hypothetical protein
MSEALGDTAGEAVAPPAVTVGVVLGAIVAVADGDGDESAPLPHEVSAMLASKAISFFMHSSSAGLRPTQLAFAAANAYAPSRT